MAAMGQDGQGEAVDVADLDYGLESGFDPAVSGDEGLATVEDVAQVGEAVADLRLQTDAAGFVHDYPHLAVEENAAPFLETVHQRAEALGRPELVHDVNFWRIVAAGTEGAPQTHEPVDLGDLIIGSDHLGRGALPF